MANPHDDPFGAYLRRLDTRLRGLPVERRSAIRRELLAHLADAAAEQSADPADPQLQQQVITRDGEVTAVVGLGPDGGVDAPQWLPGGEALLLTTYPQGGRRIVAVTATTGSVADLTRPRWDAFGILRPDGGAVLLWNGRGGLWIAPDGGAALSALDNAAYSRWISCLLARKAAPMGTRRSSRPTPRPRGARLRDYLLAIGMVLGIGAVGLGFAWWQQWRLAQEQGSDPALLIPPQAVARSFAGLLAFGCYRCGSRSSSRASDPGWRRGWGASSASRSRSDSEGTGASRRGAGSARDCWSPWPISSSSCLERWDPSCWC